MILQKYQKKLSTLGKTLKFIYGRYTLPAVIRDILFIISTVAELAGIAMLGKFIDATAQILLNWTSFDLATYFSTPSFLYLSLVFVSWCVAQVCYQAREHFYTVIYEKVWEDTRYMLIAKVSKSNLQDVEKEEFQNLMTYIPAFSIDRIISTYCDFSTVISNVIRFVSALIILFSTMGWSVLLLLLIALPENIAVHLRRKKIRNFQDEKVGCLKYLNYLQNVALTIGNFSELRVNDTYAYLKRQYNDEYDEYLKGYLKTDANFYQDKTIFSLIDQALKFTYVIYLLAFSLLKGLSIGTFKALYDYVDVAYGSIYNIFNSTSLISTKLDYAAKFFDLIEYSGFGDYKHGDLKLGKGTPTIEIKNLSFSYPDDPEVKILKGINIEIKPGEKVAFFGGDGSGKSTMVKILTGLYEIISGDYLVGGHSVRELDRGELKKKLSVTFQDFVNYNFSVKENVVISGERLNIKNDLYKEVGKVTEVTDFLKKEKIEDSHILGKTFPKGKDLSPGYWQRLAIARMLYRDKKIFVMDEPFTYIDSIASSKILNDVIDFIGKDRSLIYITRTTLNLQMFDRIYYFENGRVAESGTWKELMALKGKLYEEIKSNK